MEKKLVSAIMLILFLSSMLVTSFLVQAVINTGPETGWLGNWSYRKSHVVGSALGAGTNYQIKIKVHYGSGFDNGQDVYSNDHCRTDFGDVRFTGDDGTTELDYWLEEKADGNYAIFWVEIPDNLSLHSRAIYVYYGNSNAMTTSNGGNTFEEFTDFLGTSLPSDWETKEADIGITEISNSKLRVSSDSSLHSTWQHRIVGPIAQFTVPNRVRAEITSWQRTTARKGPIFAIGDTALRENNIVDYYNLRRHQVSSNWNGTALHHWAHNETEGRVTRLTDPDSSGIWELQSCTSFCRLLIDDSIVHTHYDYLPSGTLHLTIGVNSGCGYGSSGHIELDWIFVSKFTVPEPAHGSWGAEEQIPYVLATLDVDPDTLHLMSQAQWVTCYIELPEGYNVGDVDVSTILLNDTIPLDPEAPTEIGDYDSDGVPDLMAKFDRAIVSELILSKRITNGYVTLLITGEVNGAPFGGEDTIRVLMTGGGTKGHK